MCLDDNVTYFRTYNVLFAVVHAAFLVAAGVTYMQVRDTWRPYYDIAVVHDQVLHVYPLLVSLVMHTAGLLFHAAFALTARSIVEDSIAIKLSNPWRWFLQLFAEGAGLAGIMVIQGVAHLETVGVTLLIFAAVLALCYFQDEYLNSAYDFMPSKEPHLFAIPLYALLIVFITIKSTEHVDQNLNIRVAVASLVSLFQTSLMFVIQRLHIYWHRGAQRVAEGTAAAEEDGDEEARGEVKVAHDTGDSQRRAIFYEIIHYVNSTLFMMTVSWITISITREDVVLQN
jgi:hypothetical protein